MNICGLSKTFSRSSGLPRKNLKTKNKKQKHLRPRPGSVGSPKAGRILKAQDKKIRGTSEMTAGFIPEKRAVSIFRDS